MDIFTRADLRDLLAEHERPCVSLFMPAHRGGAEEDPIRFRKLLGQAEERLIQHGLRAPEAKEFLAPLHSLLEDVSFWPNQCDGLAVFLARDFMRIYRLPWRFQEEVEVGGLFQVAPLLPLLHGDGRFFVLAVSQNSVRLFQGTRFTVSPVDLRRFPFSLIGPKGVPPNLAEALLTHDKDEPLTFHTRPTSGGSWGAIFEGHGVGIDDEKDDLLRYFQRIDRGLHDVLREERAPLVLAAVEYLQPIYRDASTYPHLLAKGIEGNPDRLNEKELHDRAWAIVEPQFQENVRQAVALYHQAIAHFHPALPVRRATADVNEIIRNRATRTCRTWQRSTPCATATRFTHSGGRTCPLAHRWPPSIICRSPSTQANAREVPRGGRPCDTRLGRRIILSHAVRARTGARIRSGSLRSRPGISPVGPAGCRSPLLEVIPGWLAKWDGWL
jgi:hypothetical protein